MSKSSKNKSSSFFVDILVSAALHAVIFFLISVIMNFSSEEYVGRSPYVQIYTIQNETDAEEEITAEEKVTEENEPPAEETTVPEKQPEKEPASGGYISLNDNISDTTGLQNIYKETTLNVRIRYPAGWTFIDQNVKDKLDGVTFWGTRGTYDPPPYIHFEVKEKYLFNPSRYKYSKQMRDYTAYYNDPKELAGQVSQEVYLVTDTDEDYSIKLIMEGEEAFKSFQPVFFGMLETFRFGKSFF